MNVQKLKNNSYIFMKSAQQSATKFVERAGAASGEYLKGAEQTSKDQAAAAIAAAPLYAAGVQQAITQGRFQKGLGKSGKQGWLAGVREKGQNRFGAGVAASSSKYATESAKYDGARGAAASLPRGLKGSDQNLGRVKAVVVAQRQLKIGSGN